VEGSFRKNRRKIKKREREGYTTRKTETEETMDEHRGFYIFNTPPETERCEVCVDGGKCCGIGSCGRKSFSLVNL